MRDHVVEVYGSFPAKPINFLDLGQRIHSWRLSSGIVFEMSHQIALPFCPFPVNIWGMK